jgi:uncharacterized membrane protein HdeD (DUF308 family)
MSFVEIPSDEEVAGRWKWFFGFGVVIAILGLIALLNVVDATLVTTVFVGFMLVFGGIASIIGAFASTTSVGWRVLMGILGVLYILVGVNIIANPFAGAVALTVVVGIVLIAEGVIRGFNVFTQPSGHRVLNGTIAVIDLLLGFWLLTNIPISGVAIGFFVGLQLLMAGILWMAIGWMARSATQVPAAPRSAV